MFNCLYFVKNNKFYWDIWDLIRVKDISKGYAGMFDLGRKKKEKKWKWKKEKKKKRLFCKIWNPTILNDEYKNIATMK